MKTRQVFREHIVGWVLREIRDEFDAAGVPCDLEYQPSVSGERRSLVEQYYHAVDWMNWHDVKKVLQVFESVLAKESERLQLLQNAERIDAYTAGLVSVCKLSIKRMIDALKRDSFDVADGKIISGVGLPSLNDVKETATEFDASHLMEQIKRMEQAVESDPSLAIGTAKELIETCCHTIMAERGKPITGIPDIPALTKQVLKELNLIPDGVPERAKGSDIIKRLLSNLATIGQGLTEIRNLYGTGHGRDGKTKGLKTRHAKLAVGAAATLATFLFETHKEM